MPSVFDTSECPTSVLPVAELHGRDLLGIRRMPAITRPQVSSAVAMDAEPWMKVGRHHDSEPGAGVDVDVGIDAPLADQEELWEPLQEGGADLGALPDEHEGLRLGEPLGEPVDVLHMVRSRR